MLNRRALLTWLGAAAAGAPRAAWSATPESDALDLLDLELEGDPKLARRALLLLPKPRPKQPLRLLVLLHGLGETGNELLGIHAWGERYGLVSSIERLKAPPIERTLKQPYLTDDQRVSWNKALEQQPYRGLAIVCPVTPNPHRPGPAVQTLDRYADWVERTLLPAVRKRANLARGARHVGLDGCSLGGYVGLELFLRKPQLFGSLGSVQGAFSVPAALNYAERIAQAIRHFGPRPIHLETSTQDPYRKANEALSRRLHKLSVPNLLSVLPGPHNQPWLREVGTIDMLMFHDRQLG